MGVILVEILRRYNWDQIGMLIDSGRCGVNLLSQIDVALDNATDITITERINVEATNSDAIRIGLGKLKKSARSIGTD